MKRLIGGLLAVVFLGIAGIAGVHDQQNKFVSEPATIGQASQIDDSSTSAQSVQPVNDTSSSSSATTNDTGTAQTNLSNSNTYTNVDGDTVHSPANSTDGSVPAGATARCNDGTYSFSQHRSGTCSHHGGVSEWL